MPTMLPSLLVDVCTDASDLLGREVTYRDVHVSRDASGVHVASVGPWTATGADADGALFALLDAMDDYRDQCVTLDKGSAA